MKSVQDIDIFIILFLVFGVIAYPVLNNFSCITDNNTYIVSADATSCIISFTADLIHIFIIVIAMALAIRLTESRQKHK